MEEVKEKARGVAILAYLYMQIGPASWRDTKQIGGCLSPLM